MTLQEFFATLNTKNSYYQDFVCEIGRIAVFQNETELIFEKKDNNLVELVARLGQRKCYPVVDKKLRIVIGCEYTSSAHEIVRAHLCAYHRAAEEEQMPDFVEYPKFADEYLVNGYGYYISSMVPDRIVAGKRYRPDRFDKDLFLQYRFIAY